MKSWRVIRMGILVFGVAGLSFLVSCAKVPKEAVTLSTIAVQASHEQFVRQYFDLARLRVEDFLKNRWVPEFLGRFVEGAELTKKLEEASSLSEDDIARLRKELQNVVASNELEPSVRAVQSALGGDAERGKITIQFAQAAMKQIEIQRAELIEPLNQLENQALNELRGTYAELIQMQTSVTSFVTSARKVQVEQDEILERLKLLRARDQVVAHAIRVNDEIVKATAGSEKATEIVEKIKSIGAGGGSKGGGGETGGGVDSQP